MSRIIYTPNKDITRNLSSKKEWIRSTCHHDDAIDCQIFERMHTGGGGGGGGVGGGGQM